MKLQKNNGFSLVELLVVIGIIMILILIMFPAFSTLQERGRRIQCLSQLRQIGIAVLEFANENDQHLPASTPNAGPPDSRSPNGMDNTKGLLGKEIRPDGVRFNMLNGMNDHRGALVDYLGGVEMIRRLWRCPSHPFIERGSGVGSNGLFDYTMFSCFGGSRMHKLPRKAFYRAGDSQSTEYIDTVVCPLLVEEAGVNINGYRWHETEFSNGDPFSSAHGDHLTQWMAMDMSGHSIRFDQDYPVPSSKQFWAIPVNHNYYNASLNYGNGSEGTFMRNHQSYRRRLESEDGGVAVTTSWDSWRGTIAD